LPPWAFLILTSHSVFIPFVSVGGRSFANSGLVPTSAPILNRDSDTPTWR
jgi:hypothetical protein